jgi:hypothetical protein
MSIVQVCEWLESTPVGVVVRESMWGFPVLVAIHILGLTLSVGSLLWFDLRLLGVSMRRVPIAELYRRLMPWMVPAFVAMFITGVLLFTGFATKAYGNVYFRIKLAAMLLAAMNAFIFHVGAERGIAQWNDAAHPPLPARIAGLASLMLWTVVIMAGRMMSYTMF